jgi:hypothetical protein
LILNPRASKPVLPEIHFKVKFNHFAIQPYFRNLLCIKTESLTFGQLIAPICQLHMADQMTHRIHAALKLGGVRRFVDQKKGKQLMLDH